MRGNQNEKLGFGNTVSWVSGLMMLSASFSKSKYIGRSSSVVWGGKMCFWAGGNSEEHVEGADLWGLVVSSCTRKKS